MLLTESQRITRLEPPQKPVRIVIDTDTYNEVDDQFAVVYALRSPDRMTVEALYAAPFFNNRSDNPADGMERSYAEILNLLDKIGHPADGFVYRGATDYLSDDLTPQRTAASEDLVKRALASPADDPLVVVAIGAITNVASAILMEPNIINRMVVIWLGGHARHWHHTREFNLKQDPIAARIVFDSSVPLVHIPCDGVTTHLQTTTAELEHYLRGKSAIADYLIDIVTSYEGNPYGWSKVIWDVATIAYLVNPAWVPTQLVSSPILTENITWSFDDSRHLVRYAYYLHRDAIFADLFRKLST